MELDWLQNIASGWLTRLEQDRRPHAVLLIGPPGTGKRATAAWMAERMLGVGQPGDLPVHPFAIPEHADLQWLQRPEDKHTVGIDQVRELVNELSLTSYEGLGKVAVIDPANAMTDSAANGLLKTLEEPPGNTLLILVADRAGRLPATIFSRCQRITFPCPPEHVSLRWLDRQQPGARWAPALQAAGGAPLAALIEIDRLDETEALARDFAGIAAGQAGPIEVAARWAKMEPARVLDWLGGQVQQCIHRASRSAPSGAMVAVPDSVLHRIDTRNLFCYLDTINRLRGQATGSWNVQLTFEGLLIDWAEGLSGVTGATSVEDARLSFVKG